MFCRLKKLFKLLFFNAVLWGFIHAEKKYDAFLNEIVHYKPQAQLGLLLAVLIYREILDEVRRNKYDCLNKRQAVSVLRKGQIKINAEKMLESMRVGNFFG